jgi:O-succinylbenzoic acid--CoA ligase
MNLQTWRDYSLPSMRLEAHYGDRTVSCFSERPPSVYAMFSAAVTGHPDALAVIGNERRWTYRAAQAEVERIAAGLAAGHIGQGDRVAMFISNRPEFIFVFYAIEYLGAIAVPVGVREQRPGLAYMLQQCGARAIVFDSELAARIPDAAEVPSIMLRIAIGGAVDGAQQLDQLECMPGSLGAAYQPREEDTAVILYTSGTTGKPKGATLTHLNIVHSVLHFQHCFGLQTTDRAALVVPASHVTGLIAVIATMVHVAGSILVIGEFKAAIFLAQAAQERMTYTIMVPAMYNLCLLQPDLTSHDLRAWRIGSFGGAPMPVATIDMLAQKLPDLILANAYGATETTSPSTIMPLGLMRANINSVGIAVPCADVRVVDEDGQEQAPGVSGELWIGGPMVVPGYWDNPAATASEFSDGYWHSGDIGSKDAAGFVRILDRKKDMINRGGYKIYSAEVENVLMGLPGVVDAAVVGVPCPVLGERVHAFLHTSADTLDVAAVRTHCAVYLTDYKVPETVTFSTTALPRNANGKLLKRNLRELLSAAL